MVNISGWLIFIAVIAGVVSIINLISFLRQSKDLNRLRRLRRISPNQYENLKHQNLSNFIQVSSLILVSFLMLITIITGIFQILSNENISEQNRELIKQTSSSNWAHLEFNFGYPGESKILVDANRLSEPSNVVVERYSILLTIINSGKINTELYNRGYFDDVFIHTSLKMNEQFNISPQSGIKEPVYLIQSGCSVGSEESCNSSKIPSGDYNLVLRLNCDFCEPSQRTINLTIPLCIYHNSEEYNSCKN